jgi:STE24 endopeptidase
MQPLLWLFIFLALGRFILEIGLAQINLAHARRHRHALPPQVQERLPPGQMSRVLAYLAARTRFDAVETAFWLLFILACVLSGAIPRADALLRHRLGLGALPGGLLLFGGFALAQELLALPFRWHEIFRLEGRFGFNYTTRATFWLDLAKGLLVKTAVGLPLGALLLWLLGRGGTGWWLPVALSIIAFQVLVLWLHPLLIAPLFNRFTPLPAGPLRDRLHALAAAHRFPVERVSVMDGSRRSAHLNAFFTGFGRHRRLVLFDTLLHQLNERELAAVLLHEIGHWRRRHVPRLLLILVLIVFTGALGASRLLSWPPFLDAFGLRHASPAAALLLLSLVAGAFLFWVGPLLRAVQRRFEHQADAYAAGTGDDTAAALESALLQLTERNLDNPIPHGWYSRYHHSHPTLLERLTALRPLGEGAPPSSAPAQAAAGLGRRPPPTR